MVLTNKEEENVIKLYNEGYSTIELSELYNCNSVTISNKLRKNKIKIRKYSNKRNRKRKVDLSFFKKIDNNVKSYILGLIVSDGSIDKDGYGFQLTSKDYSQVDIFKKSLQSEHKICEVNSYDKRTQKTYKRFNIHICSKEMTSDLKKLGILNNKSFTCPMPNIPYKYFWHFLRGLIDGDGWATDKYDGRVRIGMSGSEKVIDYVKSFLENLGFSKIKKQIQAENKEGKVVSVTYNSFKDVSYLREKLYENSKNLRLERKYNIIKNVKKHVSNPHKYKKWKKIKVIDLLNKEEIVFDNIKLCKEELKINRSEYIYRVLRKDRNKYKNYTFEYI